VVSYSVGYTDIENPELELYSGEETIKGQPVISDFNIDWLFDETIGGNATLSIGTNIGEMGFSFVYFLRLDLSGE
jgi:hypothetical protein